VPKNPKTATSLRLIKANYCKTHAEKTPEFMALKATNKCDRHLLQSYVEF